MSKAANQKVRILCLLDILKSESDEAHPISAKDILCLLGKNGFAVERKTLYDDIKALCDYGISVESKPNSGYYIYSRTYEPAELKMLVDIIGSANFLTHKKSSELIKKLYGETSRFGAAELDRQVYTAGVRAANEVIYYTVDAIHTAIRDNKKISFKYFQYDEHKSLVEKHPDRPYKVSPLGLVWCDENYYLVAYYEKEEEIRHYRVDRMGNVNILRESRTDKSNYQEPDFSTYETKAFGMFGGNEERVTLNCKNSAAGAVIDKFGKLPTFILHSNGTFDVTVHVFLSPQFYGWLFGMSGLVKLISPTCAVEEYDRLLKSALSSKN